MKEHLIRSLIAAYRPEHQAWEANRLVKNIAMACVAAAFPVTYSPGTLLTIAVCTMLTYVCWHAKCRPVKFSGTLFNPTI